MASPPVRAPFDFYIVQFPYMNPISTSVFMPNAPDALVQPRAANKLSMMALDLAQKNITEPGTHYSQETYEGQSCQIIVRVYENDEEAMVRASLDTLDKEHLIEFVHDEFKFFFPGYGLYAALWNGRTLWTDENIEALGQQMEILNSGW